jgi:hypothetical protein
VYINIGGLQRAGYARVPEAAWRGVATVLSSRAESSAAVATARSLEGEGAPDLFGQEPEAETIEIVEMPEPLGIFAAALLRRSVEYLDAFERLTTQQRPILIYASYFLLTHSLKLYSPIWQLTAHRRKPLRQSFLTKLGTH